MADLLALVASLFYGVTDFTSGALGRRMSVYAITGFAAAVSGLIFFINAYQNGTIAFDQTTVTAGILTGVFLLGGNLAFLLAVRGAPMGVVGGITTMSALVPVAFAMTHGEAISASSLVGVVIVLGGVVMLGAPDMKGRASAAAIGMAVLCALLFGLRTVAINIGSKESSFAVLFLAEVVAVVALGAGAIVTRSLGGIARRDLIPIAFIGLLNALAFAAYSVATRDGNLAVVAVLGGLAPLALALLAWLIVKEKLARVQVVALLTVVLGGILVALG